MTTLQRIRAETGQSAVESIKIHAEQGCSKLLTASTLEISRQTLYRICTRFDLHKYFKPQGQQKEGCKQPGGKGWPKGKKRNRPPKYSNEYLFSLVNRYPTSYLFEHHTEIAASTVIRRFGSWSDALKLSQERVTQ